MFFSSIKLKNKITVLEDQISSLEIELDRVKARKKTEEQELKHMIKMKEERNQIEFDRKVMDSQRVMDDKIADIKDGYRDKIEERLIKEGENIKDMQTEILKRLPNISARLTGAL